MRKSIVQLINKPYTIKSKTIAGSTVTQTGKAWQLAAEVVIGAAIGFVGATMMSEPLNNTPFDFEEKARRELEEETKQELERRLEQLVDELETTQVLLDMEKQDNELLNEEIVELRRARETPAHNWFWMDTAIKLEKDLKDATNRVWQLEDEIDTASDLLDIATQENEELNEELSKLRRIQEDAAWKEVSSKLNTESVNDNEGAIASSTIPATAAAVADGEDDYW